MKRFFCLLLLWELGMGTFARAQQIICEKQLLATAPQYRQPTTLVRLQADSLRLVSGYYPAGPTSFVQVRVQGLNLTNCDTLFAGSTVLTVSRTSVSSSVPAANRRGQVLLAQALSRPLAAGASDSGRVVLQLFNRNGTARWRRTLVPQSVSEGISGIIEAPENGFFLFGGEYYPPPTGSATASTYDIVVRLDSTGRELWRRRYRRIISRPLESPVYSRAGNLVCAADYAPGLGQAPMIILGEFSQTGDSLASHLIAIVPQQETRITFPHSPNSFLPLRDGGFALIGQVDSANTGYCRPFLARLDQNLNLTWSYIYRAQATQNFRFTQP